MTSFQLASLCLAAASLAACGPSSQADPTASDADAGTSGDAAAGDAANTRPDATADAPHPTIDGGIGEAGLDAMQDATDGSAVTDAPVDLGLDCSGDASDASDAGPPTLLGCTGLYSQWPSRTIAPDAMPFDPGLHLFSDGATKRRWIRLPPSTTIDTSDMDNWVFPVGTKVWKEFSLNGKKLETRYMLKRGDGDWFRTTYRWSDDQTAADEFTTGSIDADGYEIPSQAKCGTCHAGRPDNLLGFEAVSLSSPGASGLTMSALVASARVTNAPSAPLTIPGNATEAAALGYLHANCGTSCHNSTQGAFAGGTGFRMRLNVAQLGSAQGTDTYTTGVNVVSNFQVADGGGSFVRIAPHDATRSAVAFRISRRDTQGEGYQMPPIDTHVVDATAVTLINQWIGQMP